MLFYSDTMAYGKKDEADLTNLCIDKVQAGLGCEDSWGRIARPEYLVPYADYEFTFILFPRPEPHYQSFSVIE